MTANCVNIGRDEESLNIANINLLVGFNKTREIYKAYIDFGIFSLYFIVVICENFRFASTIYRYTNADLKICQYIPLHMKIICGRFHIKRLLRFEICAREIYEKFVYKHLETTEYVKN